jgi:hypothetical protein
VGADGSLPSSAAAVGAPGARRSCAAARPPTQHHPADQGFDLRGGLLAIVRPDLAPALWLRGPHDARFRAFRAIVVPRLHVLLDDRWCGFRLRGDDRRHLQQDRLLLPWRALVPVVIVLTVVGAGIAYVVVWLRSHAFWAMLNITGIGTGAVIGHWRCPIGRCRDWPQVARTGMLCRQSGYRWHGEPSPIIRPDRP